MKSFFINSINKIRKKTGGTSLPSVYIPSEKNPSQPFTSSQRTFLSQMYSGKLLLRDEINLSEKTFQNLLNKGYFKQYPAITRSFFHLRCRRCNNKNITLFAQLPCARCKKVHYYCRNCIAMGRVLECEKLYAWNKYLYKWPEISSPCTWKGTLTDMQQVAAEKIKLAVHKRREHLIWAVTGSGKTEMLFPGISEALQMGMRVCLATPRADVVRELLPRLRQAFNNVSIEGLYSDSEDKDGNAQFIIATTHQLLRYKRAFDLLIIDEIDAFPYHQDNTLQFAAARATKRRAARIYLTATPRSTLRRRMNINRLPYTFVPKRFHGHLLPIPTFTYITTKRDQPVPKQFYTWVTSRDIPARQLLIFVPTIAMARSITPLVRSFLREKGIISDASYCSSVHAADDEREQKVRAFRERKIFALITTTILERGVTFPSIDVAVLQADHDVFDTAALVQIAGRAGRNKKDPYGNVAFFFKQKTNAIVQAKNEILSMNKRAKSNKD